MATEFDKIKNLAGWRAKLDELLAAARDAAKIDDLDQRLEVADRLTAFIINNPPVLSSDPSTLEYDDMDRVAKEAHDGLLLATIQERVAVIMSKTAELAALRKKIEGRSAANRKAAESIQLEKVRRVVDATTEAVSAMTDLKKQIDSAQENGLQNEEMLALGQKLETLIASIQTVRSEVETIS